MPNSRFMCLALLGVLASVGCRTTVGLTDGPPAAPMAGAVGNRPPSVKIEGASERGSEVAAGTRLTLLAEVYDADGDEVTLAWSASAGTLSGASTPRTRWTAPATATSVTITVRATDSRGASATDTLSLVVQAKP